MAQGSMVRYCEVKTRNLILEFVKLTVVAAATARIGAARGTVVVSLAVGSR